MNWPHIKMLIVAMLMYFSHDMKKPEKDCAPSQDSGQPGHSLSLIKVFAVCSVDNLGHLSVCLV